MRGEGQQVGRQVFGKELRPRPAAECVEGRGKQKGMEGRVEERGKKEEGKERTAEECVRDGRKQEREREKEGGGGKERKVIATVGAQMRRKQ